MDFDESLSFLEATLAGKKKKKREGKNKKS